MARGLLTIVAMAAMLLGSMEVSAPAVAQDLPPPPTPRLRATPECIPGDGATTAVRLRGSGFEPGSRVDIRVAVSSLRAAGAVSSVAVAGRAAAQANEPLATVGVDDLGTFETSVDLSPGGPSGTFSLVAVTRGDGPRAEAPMTVPCDAVTLEAITDCGPENGGASPPSVRTRGGGFIPGDDQIHVWSPTRETNAMIDRLVTADETGGFRVDIPLGDLPQGLFEVIAVSPNDQSAAALLEAPCPALDILLLPDCADPGQPPDRMEIGVVAAGFHPVAPALVVWDGPGSHEVWYTRTDRQGGLTISITPYRRPEGRYTLRIRTDGGEASLRQHTQDARIPPRQRTVAFLVPCETPDVSVGVQPDCSRPLLAGEDERLWSIEVRGDGFEPGEVSVVFDAEGIVEPRPFALPVDGSGTFRGTIEPPAGPAGRYRIEASQSIAGSATLSRLAPIRTIVGGTFFRAPCNPRTPPPPELAPDCGPPGPGVEDAYEITVDGSGFYPGGLVFVTFGRGEGVREFVADAEDGSFSRTILVRGRNPGEYPVRAVQRDAARNELASATASFGVPCPIDPSIAIRPGHGPAGYTALVEGSDFEPGSTVTLTWDSGIQAGTPFAVSVEADGSFEVYLFILPNDWPGERMLRAGLPDDPGAFPTVTADYVVVPGPGVPPSGSGGGIVNRR